VQVITGAGTPLLRFVKLSVSATAQAYAGMSRTVGKSVIRRVGFNINIKLPAQLK